MKPLIRLGMGKAGAALLLRTAGRLAIAERSADSDPLRFLFVALWACKELKAERVNVSELREVWQRLRGSKELGRSLSLHMPQQASIFADKMRDWAKKINKNADIRIVQEAMSGRARVSDGRQVRGRNTLTRDPFMALSTRNHLGAEPEVWFQGIVLDELDWDDTLIKLAIVPNNLY